MNASLLLSFKERSGVSRGQRPLGSASPKPQGSALHPLKKLFEKSSLRIFKNFGNSKKLRFLPRNP